MRLCISDISVINLDVNLPRYLETTSFRSSLYSTDNCKRFHLARSPVFAAIQRVKTVLFSVHRWNKRLSWHVLSLSRSTKCGEPSVIRTLGEDLPAMSLEFYTTWKQQFVKYVLYLLINANCSGLGWFLSLSTNNSLVKNHSLLILSFLIDTWSHLCVGTRGYQQAKIKTNLLLGWLCTQDRVGATSKQAVVNQQKTKFAAIKSAQHVIIDGNHGHTA